MRHLLFVLGLASSASAADLTITIPAIYLPALQDQLDAANAAIVATNAALDSQEANNQIRINAECARVAASSCPKVQAEVRQAIWPDLATFVADLVATRVLEGDLKSWNIRRWKKLRDGQTKEACERFNAATPQQKNQLCVKWGWEPGCRPCDE